MASNINANLAVMPPRGARKPNFEGVPRDDLGALLAELYRRALRLEPETPLVEVSGYADLEAAVSAVMHAHAHDFIAEPVDTKILIHAIARAVEQHKPSPMLERLHGKRGCPRAAVEILGSSPTIRAVFDLVGRVAVTEVPVLILGESGTDKELVARAIHEASPRGRGPFVALNCAALTASLIESELFGHVKGAFTDARHARDGLFVQANGGTLFLDEIADLPLELQPKLLRALQEREVRPVGGQQEVGFDARIITATNVDLAARIAESRFREDLMYRIDVVRIDLPPLRERGHDILLLANHLLRKYGGKHGASHTLTDDASAKLLAYDWPGNVRELENCIQRALAVAHHDQVEVEDLPLKIQDHHSHQVMLGLDSPEVLVTLEELESRYIRKVLEMVHGNKARAARLLGVDRRSLYRRLHRLGIS